MSSTQSTAPMDDELAFLLAARLQQGKKRNRRGARAAPKNHTAPAQRSPSQRAGDQGEEQALALLQSHGLELLARQLSCPLGEIDLVMREGDTLVFVEVRARASARYGGAAASITPDKARRLRHTAQFFLPRLIRQHYGGIEPVCRFDVVLRQGATLLWLRAALDEQANNPD